VTLAISWFRLETEGLTNLTFVYLDSVRYIFVHFSQVSPIPVVCMARKPTRTTTIGRMMLCILSKRARNSSARTRAVSSATYLGRATRDCVVSGEAGLGLACVHGRRRQLFVSFLRPFSSTATYLTSSSCRSSPIWPSWVSIPRTNPSSWESSAFAHSGHRPFLNCLVHAVQYLRAT